ncbi:MAG: hypothetical protein AAF908_10335, partial [Pseudomonadota bacterium]
MSDPTDGTDTGGAEAGVAADPSALAQGIEGLDAIPPEEAVEAGGVAFQTLSAIDRAAEQIALGGPVVAILLVMSAVALGIALAKLWQFAGSGLGDRRTPRTVVSLYRAGDAAAAFHAARGGRGPAS